MRDPYHAYATTADHEELLMSVDTAPEKSSPQGGFTSRRVFILAAIGSAVGLGNIWRFPYVAYENGGGAFIIPYLVALLAAGIPLLLLDYSLGHKQRGSAPLSYARTARRTEALGWWQVGICFVIAVYYAVIIAWAVRYMLFSASHAWGDKPDDFFFNTFLQVGDPGVTLTVVPGVLWPLAIVWGVVLLIMLLGVQRGIGNTAAIFIPILILAFGFLVVRSLFLPGAAEGLNALFTPNWAALTEPGVWAAAFGQIFFSLSVGFGIMITYSAYVGRKTDMTGSGLVVGFANSGFELLAGIGVFAALGFMAQASGVAVNEVATSGIGLAFVAFPAIINEAPAGTLIGLLFFISLVLAGITSLVSIIEVVIAAVRDKFELGRTKAVLVVGLPSAIISLIFFSTTSGLYVLDIADHFINQFGILLVAVVSMLVLSWGVRVLGELAEHLNLTGSLKLGSLWKVFISVLTPLVLLYALVNQLITDLKAPYEDYPQWMLIVFGWGVAVAVIVVAVLLSQVSWRSKTSLAPGGAEEDLEEVNR